MKTSNLTLVIFIIVFLLYGCGLINLQSDEYIPPKCLTDNSCDGYLVENQTCAPPCWQGLTPGETSFEEAWEILRGLNFLNADIILDQLEVPAFGKRIIFFPIDQSWKGVASFENDILAFLAFSGELFANFETASAAIASPTSVIVLRDYRGGLQFYVIEMESGVLLSTGQPRVRLDLTDSIEETTPILGISYFDKKLIEPLYQNKMLFMHSVDVDPWTDAIQPWLGYGTITDRYEISKFKDDY